MEPLDFYKLQVQKALQELESHWLKILNLEDKSSFDKRGTVNFVPWFGDLGGWLAELKDVDYGTYPEFDLSASKIYPKAVCDKNDIRNIAMELDLLLPEGDSVVCGILPVLITGYIVNRRVPAPKSKAKGSDYGGTPEFADFLLDCEGPQFYRKNEEQKQLNPRKMMHKKTKLFVLREWNARFPKIKYSQLNKGKAQMLLSGYGDMRLFFFLLYKLRDKCNVSLSYFVFEAMTGFVDLLTNDGTQLCDGIIKSGVPWFADENEVLSDSKKDLLLSSIKEEFADLFEPISNDAEPLKQELPMSLYKYLYNLKEALIDREAEERGTPLSKKEIEAGYKLFADLDFIFGKKEGSLSLSDFLDDDILEEILKDEEKMEIRQ